MQIKLRVREYYVCTYTHEYIMYACLRQKETDIIRAA